MSVCLFVYITQKLYIGCGLYFHTRWGGGGGGGSSHGLVVLKDNLNPDCKSRVVFFVIFWQYPNYYLKKCLLVPGHIFTKGGVLIFSQILCTYCTQVLCQNKDWVGDGGGGGGHNGGRMRRKDKNLY